MSHLVIRRSRVRIPTMAWNFILNYMSCSHDYHQTTQGGRERESTQEKEKENILMNNLRFEKHEITEQGT